MLKPLNFHNRLEYGMNYLLQALCLKYPLAALTISYVLTINLWHAIRILRCKEDLNHEKNLYTFSSSIGNINQLR